MTVDGDYSFKQQGSVPFKWEVVPGVPKKNHQPEPPQTSLPQLEVRKTWQMQPQPPVEPPPPSTSFIHWRSSLPSSCNHHQQPQQKLINKLKPPPALAPSSESLSNSFRSNPGSHSERWQFDHSTQLRPGIVSSRRFLRHWFRRKDKTKKTAPMQKHECESETNSSELDTLAWLSESTRKLFSPYSPSSGSDSDWAGFGLF
ncbi:hypothetical protein ACFE04_013873 [Oxalis oulophora]